jgi:hypothetical protein
MLDVHPAPHAALSLREFLVHIATIVLGLVIAVGLEHAVELIHRNHQLHAIEAALHEESLKNRNLVQYDLTSVDEVRRNIRRNMAALDAAHPDKPLSLIPPAHDTFLPFIDTAWVSARDRGLVSILPDNLAENYWKVNVLTDATTVAIMSIADARMKVNSLVYLHADPSHLTTDEREALLRAYSEEDQQLGNLNYILHGFDFMNEAAIAGRVPTIAELAAESRQAQQTEAQPPAHP